MNTNIVTLPLSESLSAFVQEEAASQGKVEALLLEGLHSGPATPMKPEDWVEIRRQAKEQLAAEQSQ